MSNAKTNSMAAILSQVVLFIYWLAIISGIVGFLLAGTGLLGSLNGGAVKLPGMQAYVQGVHPGRMFVAMVGIVVFAVGITYVCSQLRRILSTLAAGDPFVPENGPRLTRIAIAIAMIEIVRTLATLIIAATVDLGEGFTASVTLNLTVWGAVVVLFVLAQVFREGSRLREDAKMTI